MRIFGVIVLLALAAVPARAEDWTWERFVEEAERGNPGLAAARASVDRAEAAARGSYGAFLPQITGSTDYSRSGGDGRSGGSFGNDGVDSGGGEDGGRDFGSSSRESYSFRLNAQQPLFTGFRLEGEVGRSRAELDEALAALEAAGAQATFDLAGAFAELVFAQSQVDLAKEILERRNANVRLIELRYEAGREHKGSYLRIAAAARQAAFDLARAERAVTVAQRQIARVLGREEAATLRAAGGFPAAKPERPADFRALAERVPASLQALAQVRAASAATTVAASTFYPTLEAVGSLARRDSSFPPTDDSWSAGLSLSFPLFTGGRDWFGVRGAEAEERRAKSNAAGVEEQAALDLERTFVAYQDASEAVEVQAQFLDAASTRAEIARAQYTNGLLKFEDWDLIENDLIQARTSILQSRRDAALAKARWDFSRGAVEVQ